MSLPSGWELPSGVRIAFTDRRGVTGDSRLLGASTGQWQAFNLGNHVGDDPESVRVNRQQLRQSLTGIRQIQWLNQTHGIDCLTAVGEAVTLNSDACFSAQTGVACSVMTADCLPVLFAAADGSVVAAAHAGWRGLASGVLEQTLQTAFGSGTAGGRQQVWAYLGPAIGPKAFEVGPEVKSAFAGAPEHCFVAGKGDRLLADLHGLAQWRLQQWGVERVFSADWCTATEPERFFSYRRDGVTGRQASLIWRV